MHRIKHRKKIKQSSILLGIARTPIAVLFRAGATGANIATMALTAHIPRYSYGYNALTGKIERKMHHGGFL